MLVIVQLYKQVITIVYRILRYIKLTFYSLINYQLINHTI